MLKTFPDLPREGWSKVTTVTGLTTLAVSILAILGTLAANHLAGQQSLASDYYISATLAVFFTVPLFGFFMIKVQQLERANERLNYFATIDSLTGALNRRAFMEAVETRLVEQNQSGEVTQSALLVIDVDHFKLINDRYGHQTGDIALVRISDTIRANLRETDLFGRLGGEEFGVYLENIVPAAAIRTAEQCRQATNNCPFTPEGEDHRLSISIGIAISEQDEDFSSLFKEADNRLYLAKANGRNRIELPRIQHAA